MAEIVGRVALSHAPQLLMPPERWQDLPFRYRNADAPPPERPELAPELEEEVKAAKFQRCHDAMAVIRKQIDDWAPDAIVIIGDDQHENILNDNTPPFVVYIGDEVKATVRFRYLGDDYPAPVTNYRVDSGLARYVVDHLMDHSFDPAWSTETRIEDGLGHAFARPLNFVTPGAAYPIVPFMLNTCFPPASSPKRCVELGKAIAEAVRDYDAAERVVVMASGGLSHTQIDEELDEGFMKALTDHDLDYMAHMPAEELVSGTSEIRNWIVTAATAPKGARMIDYIPCYRSNRGIGCAMGFAVWD